MAATTTARKTTPTTRGARKPAARIPAAPRRSRHARRVELGITIGAVVLLALAWLLPDHTAAMGANTAASVALTVLAVRFWQRASVAILRHAQRNAERVSA